MTATVLRQLTDIDRRLGGLLGTVQLLLAFRLMQDGHATNLREAHLIARDIEQLRQLYPEAARG